MPIKPIVLQQRHAELGRIRLGAKEGGKGRPMKLESFRFTSHSERYIRDLAELYGGEPRPWDNNGIKGWEVFTTAQSIPVIAVKGGLTQWMEFWAGGGCMHRCDGEMNVLTGEPCDLEEQVQVGKKVINPHAEARPTTRLSVMLPELEAIGVWRMESHGWNAAAEIPAVAELAQYVGDLVPAHLHLVERRAIKDGKTSRFVVPVLDLQIGTARLKEIVAEVSSGTELSAGSGAGARAIEAPQQPEVEAPRVPTDAEIDAADMDTLKRMWSYLQEHNLLGDDDGPGARIVARVEVLRAAEATQQPAPQTAEPQANPDGTYDAEVVEDAAPAG
ncbi:recombination directionality factor, partial [Nocardioides massiliensis]